MRAEPAVVPVLPRYGESTLADLATSLLASLGIAGEANPLGLPQTARACLLVVDGLGWELLRDQPASAPFLSELAVNGAALTAGFPATTVTSLSSLGTGRPPGQHGMLGYQVAIPGKDKLLNGLRWDNSVDPRTWQPAARCTSGPPRRACAPTASRRPHWSGRACRSRSCGARSTGRRTAWAPWWPRPPTR